MYVGRDVQVTVQVPVKDEIESWKLIDYYDFPGLSPGNDKHRAYSQEAASEPAPSDAGWTELDQAGYDNLDQSDDVRHSVTTTTSGNYALMLFRFKCGFAEADVKKIKLLFEGYGTAPGGDGVTIKVWNHVGESWEHAQAGAGSGDEEITITLTENLPNYIDGDGYIWLLARTTNADDGSTHAVLYCDYVSCFVTQAKFTVDHKPISDRDMDGVADEPAHVTVKVNGTEVTVSSVDDDTGLVTLASGDFNEGDVITCSYRYDSNPFIAQEITLEPKQRIEGLDGLGSDTVQEWAVLQKEIDGSIKEAFKPGSDTQLRRLPFKIGGGINKAASANGGSILDAQVWSGFYPVSRAIDGNRDTEAKTADVRKHWVIIKFDGLYRIKRFYLKNGGYGRNRCFYYWKGGSKWQPVEENMGIGEHAWDVDVYTDRVKYSCEQTSGPYDCWVFEIEAYTKEASIEDDYGVIVTWSQAGQTVKIGLDGVVFPEGSIPSPKNAPVFMVTPFKARRIKLIE